MSLGINNAKKKTGLGAVLILNAERVGLIICILIGRAFIHRPEHAFLRR